MRGRRRILSTGTEKTGSGQLLALSMFIMLLAFFIVLTSLSSFEEEKVRPTIASVGEAFSSNTEGDEDNKPSIRDSEKKGYHEGSVIEQLEGFFTALIPKIDVARYDDRGEMYVRLTVDEWDEMLLALGERDSESEANAFLPALSALLGTAKSGHPYRVDILINTPDGAIALYNDKPQAVNALMRKAGGWAIRLEEAGLPKKLVSVGLQKGKTGMVELFFRPHVPYVPLDGAEPEPSESLGLPDEEVKT